MSSILDGFELFAAQTRGSIRIDQNGKITFNKGALEGYIKDFNYALLYFNKDKQQIAIKFLKDEVRCGVEIVKYQKKAYIACTAFFRFHDIVLTESLSVMPDYIEEENVLIVELSSGDDETSTEPPQQ